MSGLIERFFPAIIGTCVAVAWLFWGDQLVKLADTKKWHLDQIYPAIFGFLSITTGFLATFYGTIQSMSDGFVRRIRNTRVMATFIAYLKSAIVVGFVMAVLTIPMMIVTPIPSDPLSKGGLIVGAWTFGSALAIAGFFRVAHHMFYIFETRIPDNQPGG